MPPDSKTAARPTQRPKLDRRLFRLLEMGPERRSRLREGESKRLRGLATKANGNEHLYTPFSAGVAAAPDGGEVFDAFILCDGSRRDLEELGARVRSQSGDVFTAWIPEAALEALEKSRAVRYIELARPVSPHLDIAVPRAQIDVLRTGPAHADGTGVIVGVIDWTLDIYHADFRKPGTGATRVRYLWDQRLMAQGSEHPPSASNPVLPSYGVEYSEADIAGQFAIYQQALQNAYTLVRHNSAGELASHGTLVAGAATGNGRADPQGDPIRIGAAPGADLIFVNLPANVYTNGEFASQTKVCDAFQYVFARAAELGQPCVVNMAMGDNLGPHDGTAMVERFIDGLLEQPGRAVVLSAGNSTNTGAHATGRVTASQPVVLGLTYAVAVPNTDFVEIWYDSHDRFDTLVTFPDGTVIGPTPAGTDSPSRTLPGGAVVHVSSVLANADISDNVITLYFEVPPGANILAGTTQIELTAVSGLNGTFHAWLDRNNRGHAAFSSNVDEMSLTLGSPGTSRRAITVGNTNENMPPVLAADSGRGPTRDGRIKPEITAPGERVFSCTSLNRNVAPAFKNYVFFSGTSASAPLVAGACACLFQCRGAGLSWAQIKQILEDTAGTTGFAVPHNGYGFGYLQIGTGCSIVQPKVDVWLRDNTDDTGVEPYAGAVAWISPDIEVLDLNGHAVSNATHAADNSVNNQVRVTVRNRGANMARNTEVYLYWADPATFIPYPGAWNATGIFTDAGDGSGYVTTSNKIVVPQLASGQSAQVLFGWSPPAPGGNIRGDDHFCLIARVENEGDASGVGAGGWPVVTARNNIALHNVHVLALAQNMSTRFHVVGSGDRDSLVVTVDLVGVDEVRLALPVQALPWRDRHVIETLAAPRPRFRGRPVRDPLAEIEADLDGQQAEALTGIRNARRLVVKSGIATITLAGRAPLEVPDIRLEAGARAIALLAIDVARIDGARRFVHVAQRSGGRLVGGVSLEIAG